MLTQEKLRELFDYNPETGVFTRLVRMGQRGKAGAVVGSPDTKGYLQAKIRGKIYILHRLAFLFMEGYTPENYVDHKNGVVDDNRWLNLREVSMACNLQNQKLSNANKSGFTGVCWHKQNAKWHAEIQIDKKKIHIGYYATATDAAVARVNYEDSCPNWSCNHQDNNRVKLRSMGVI